MGAVASKQDDAAPIYLRDQHRLVITSVRVTNARGKVLYRISPNSFPATRYSVKREGDEDTVVEYIQDPEPATQTTAPNFLFRLNNDQEIFFYFTFVMRLAVSTPSPSLHSNSAVAGIDSIINSLTFIFASSPRELDTLLTREFNADPNLHRNPNVDLVGDYSTGGNASEEFEWAWRWRPPRSEDRGGGWRNTCSFVEYDQRAHRLNTLITFSFWVHNTQRLLYSPALLSPRMELKVPPRLRVPSNQSLDSRLSDSENELRDVRDLPSPVIEAIPENGLLLEPSMTVNAANFDINCQRPGDDVSAVDDGPLFRATLKALETKTSNMRIRMKKVLKKAEAARDAQVACNQSVTAFMQALREASASNANAVQPALNNYFEKIATEILSYEQQNAENLQKLIIDPISRLYTNEIKQVETKKKDFEDESRDYYAYVSRYLGQRQDSLKEKKRVESDEKYQSKRQTFELKRFDYSSFMQDLHGGRKDQEVLSQLTKYANTQAGGYLATAKKVEAMMPQLEALHFEVNEADKEYQLFRTGREEKRRALQKRTKLGDNESTSTLTATPGISAGGTSYRLSMVLDENKWSSDSALTSYSSERPGKPLSSGLPLGMQSTTMTGSPAMQQTGFSPAQNRSEDRDSIVRSAETSHVQQRKEGLLWSLSRPGSHIDPKGLNKQAWHKFWIVLDQGKLSEYVNWKQNLEPHMDPIDLRMASVREARNADRRFCFEVITPQFRRVYQATGEDDMRSWIQAINNALQSAFEGRAPPVEQITSTKHSGGIARDLFGKSSSLHAHRASMSPGQPASRSVARHATVGDKPSLVRSRSSEERQLRLLHMVRDADAGNTWCAECGTDRRVEWVSLNFGIIMCIECSGAHRSLGSHISKVRSLTLDTVSFTQDMTELLLQIGNRVSNMIWEDQLDRALKPTPQSSPDARLKFMTAKYKERAYVLPLSANNSLRYGSSDETLLASIKKMDMQNVLYALASGADPNATDRSRATPAVLLALAAADPASPSAQPPPPFTSSHQQQAQQPRKSFPLAELLLQNGADIPNTTGPIPLSRSAQAYLEFKATRVGGRIVPAVVSSAPYSYGGGATDTLTALPVFPGAFISGGGGGAGGASQTMPHSSSYPPRGGDDHDKLGKRLSSGSSAMGKLVKGMTNV